MTYLFNYFPRMKRVEIHVLYRPFFRTQNIFLQRAEVKHKLVCELSYWIRCTISTLWSYLLTSNCVSLFCVQNFVSDKLFSCEVPIEAKQNNTKSVPIKRCEDVVSDGTTSSIGLLFFVKARENNGVHWGPQWTPDTHSCYLGHNRVTSTFLTCLH